MTAFLTALGLRERYVGRHRDAEDRETDWKPAHTRTAARRRARLEHVRPEWQRPDLRIEQTVGLTFAEIKQMLAGGAR